MAIEHTTEAYRNSITKSEIKVPVIHNTEKKGYYRTSDSSRFFVLIYRTSQTNSYIKLAVTKISDGGRANIQCGRI